MFSSDFSAFAIDILYTPLVKHQSSFYESRRLAICIKISFLLIGLIENSWIFWKHFCYIWNFILLLTKDDSVAQQISKVVQQTRFWELVTYKPVAYKKHPLTSSFHHFKTKLERTIYSFNSTEKFIWSCFKHFEKLDIFSEDNHIDNKYRGSRYRPKNHVFGKIFADQFFVDWIIICWSQNWL